MTMKLWRTWAAGAAALVVAQPALGCATVSFSPATLTIGSWDPITPAAAQTAVTATIARGNSNVTGVRLILLDSNDRLSPVRLGSRSGMNGPPYQFLDASGANLLYPATTAVTAVNAPVINFPSKGGNSLQASLRLIVPANVPGTDFVDGAYNETLSYAVQCFSSGNKSAGTAGPISGPAVALTIPNLVSLTTASAARLDFQNFTSLTQQLNVGLRSTGPVRVDVTSTNGLKMLRVGASTPALDNSLIKYFLNLRGTDIPKTPITLTNQPRAGVSGSSWPLVLSLPNQPSGKVAGSYSDTLTITLSPGS
jgi:hypothetical protein